MPHHDLPSFTNGGVLLLVPLLIIIALCIYLIATGRPDGRPHTTEGEDQ